MHDLDSPCGELNLEPPNTYFIELRQLDTILQQILTKIIKTHKMHVQTIQGRHFLRRKTLRDAPQHRQGLGSTICCYLLLCAANHPAMCPYLPLTLPLLAANTSASCHYLQLAILLFAAHCNKLRYLPLMMSTRSSPKELLNIMLK